MGVLDKIIGRRTERLAEAKARRPLTEVRRAAESARGKVRDFRAALAGDKGRPRLIAELKKASPSKGLIRQDFDPATIAALYGRYAEAVSVLTEEDFFQGKLEYIAVAREASGLPVLRKDFIIEAYQVYEAREAGADAMLLIAAALEDQLGSELMALAQELGMQVLYEVHDHRELERVLRLGAPIIGINNRNLNTLAIDLATTFTLKKEIPAGLVVVSESGIETAEHVKALANAGVNAMLVGTSIMRQQDMEAKLRELTGA